MTQPLSGTVLERGRVLPGVALRDAESGRELRVSDLRGRRALILCFLHEECRACARFMEDLAGAAADIAEADGRVIRVASDDPTGERYLGETGERPTVVVTDRYAAAWESYPSAGHAFPPARELVETLWHLARMCPECGVPTWG